MKEADILKGKEEGKTYKQRMTEELAQSFGDDWDVFMTITFRFVNEYDRAKKRFKKLFKYINENVGPTQDQVIVEKFVECHVLFEKNQSGKGVHIHALVKGVRRNKIKKLERICERKFGISRVREYVPGGNSRYYIAKKYSSAFCVDYDFYKINTKLRPIKFKSKELLDDE